MGHEVQAIKAGLLRSPDSGRREQGDRPGAQRTAPKCGRCAWPSAAREHGTRLAAPKPRSAGDVPPSRATGAGAAGAPRPSRARARARDAGRRLFPRRPSRCHPPQRIRERLRTRPFGATRDVYDAVARHELDPYTARTGCWPARRDRRRRLTASRRGMSTEHAAASRNPFRRSMVTPPFARRLPRRSRSSSRGMIAAHRAAFATGPSGATRSASDSRSGVSLAPWPSARWTGWWPTGSGAPLPSRCARHRLATAPPPAVRASGRSRRPGAAGRRRGAFLVRCSPVRGPAPPRRVGEGAQPRAVALWTESRSDRCRRVAAGAVSVRGVWIGGRTSRSAARRLARLVSETRPVAARARLAAGCSTPRVLPGLLVLSGMWDAGLPRRPPPCAGARRGQRSGADGLRGDHPGDPAGWARLPDRVGSVRLSGSRWP